MVQPAIKMRDVLFKLWVATCPSLQQGHLLLHLATSLASAWSPIFSSLVERTLTSLSLVSILEVIQMAPVMSRVKQEQLRKRRNNLLRRHNDFWSLYGIRSWLIMEMPNRRIYTYHSHPNIPAPTSEDIVRYVARWKKTR